MNMSIYQHITVTYYESVSCCILNCVMKYIFKEREMNIYNRPHENQQ